MPMTPKEAVEIWIERARGLKIREIGAKHDVDPRRIYEVFEGKTHPQSINVARETLSKQAPYLAAKLQHHKPSLKVVKAIKGDPNQGSLF